MSKYGIIWVGHQCEDMLERSLSPWIEARKSRLGGHDFVICAVSVPFEGFSQDGPQDDTVEALLARRVGGQIDHLISNLRMDGVDDNRKWKETEARGEALQWLVCQGCDLTFMVDADEFYTSTDIFRILKFVEVYPLVDWFKISLHNAVFNEKTFLKEPFAPPRIHRVKVRGYQADSFWDDNNVLYCGTITRDLKRDIDLCCKTIPRSVAYPTHLSWLDNERSRKKCEYQESRSWKCSFRWNYDTGHLEWNPELPIPETETDS